MKEDIRRIIEDLNAAIHQPLFNGIAGSPRDAAIRTSSYHELTDSSHRIDLPASKRICTEKNATSTDTDNWDILLAKACRLLPSMTEHEHGQVSRVAGILLLGFFLPQSTGNDYFSSQNLSSRFHTESSRQQSFSPGFQTAESLDFTQDTTKYFIAMSLEERLQNSPHRYGNEFGEVDDQIVQKHLENAFQSFLKIGLRSFLLGRPAHATEVDLLHILAMAIHPHPSEQCIRQTASRLENKKSDSWEMAKRLMSSLVPNSFHINYRHRLELVKIVSDCLILPEYEQEAGICQNAHLYEGAIPHLRASLYAFGMCSMSDNDSQLAQRAMVSLAIQSRIEHVIEEEWNRLLHRLVDDRTDYTRGSENYAHDEEINFTSSLTTNNSRGNKTNFCPHTSRGLLLQEFLMRYNGARNFADEDFLFYALSSLRDAIEMQVDSWTKEEKESSENDHSPKDDNEEELYCKYPPFILAALLNAARNLFYFLLPLNTTLEPQKESEREDEEIDEPDGSNHRDMLISCGIQLVHHSHPAIQKQACSMLVIAFSYAENMWEDYVKAVFDSVAIAVDIAIESSEQRTSGVYIEGLVSCFSKHSVTFAVNLFELLLKKKNANALVTFRLIASISNACPAVAEKHIGTLKEQLTEIQEPNVKKHILASILCCRKTHYFAREEDSLTSFRPLLTSSSLGNWDTYLISRHAMTTGNFDVAKELYHNLMNLASSEKSFIWFTAMEKIADGEGMLCNNGANALPESTSKLRMAINVLRSLQSLKMCPASFQIKLLELRVCFLDLLMNLRQLTMEMRLTGTEPKKFTRPTLHLKNLIKLFHQLSIDYIRLYKLHGLFLCQQSRSALRTLHALCSFVARAASQIFLKTEGESREAFANGDIAQPLTSLLKHFNSSTLEKIIYQSQSFDAKSRALIFLQMMNGIIRTPAPIPRSVTTCREALVHTSLRFFFDHDTHESGSNQLKICSGTSIAGVASGTIPTSLTLGTKIPFNVLLLWYSLDPSVESSEFSTSSSKLPKTESGPIATSISSSGSFFVRVKSQALLHEGLYYLKFRLGCRDIRGGEWELPVEENALCFPIKVSVSAIK